MQRVTFGVTASPYVSVRTLKQAAIDFGSSYPEASHHIDTSFYVDDFFGGADTPAKAASLREDITHILNQAGFKIKKWRSSSPTVTQKIPSDLLETIPDQKLIDSHSASYPKALGLVWDSRKDQMATHVDLARTYSSTKRGVVSDIAKTFDVLGWLSPVILVMKLLYRSLWERNLSWDQQVPEDLRLQHEQWRQELPLLADIRLPRHYFNGRKPKSISMHGFSDASQAAFSAVVYIRATYSSGPPSSALVLSKTRVAPLDGRSIPELELCGAHLLAKILDSTSQTLNISEDQIWAYSDSTIVLAWLDGNPKRYKLYVANRISKTIKLMPPKVWHYVPTSLNPADCASRGLSARDLITHHLWWHGPPWLQEQPLVLPATPSASDREIELDQEHRSKKKEQQLASAAVPALGTRLEECSTSLNKVIRVTCWVMRFIVKCKKKQISSDQKLSVAEFIAAEDFLLRRAQLRSFSLEIQQLTSDPPKPLSDNCRILALQPEMNDRGLLTVGGRLRHALISEQQKHPVILSPRDIFTKLLFKQYRLDLLHAGPTAILSHSGNLFYITGAKKLARAVCQSCIICRKAAAKAGPQLMGQLPPSRLNPDFVFFHTGLDYAGPYFLKEGYVRRPVKIKAYMAVFVCFYTKAVHLEVVKDATTESLIACLSRFCSRRGLPLTIHSDNGSNLMGAKNELADLYSLLEEKETQNLIQSYLLHQRVNWETIPVKAPHFGGLWEAAVKDSKRVLGQQMYTYDELETVICQVEACLNSRPLGAVASHPLDGVVPLTPGHFLIGRALKAYPVMKIDFNPTPLQRWVHYQKMVQMFWKRWNQEYLQQLQRAVKWHHKKRNFQVGDLVLLTDGNALQCQWSNAMVVKTYPGKDKVVRAVDVQVAHKITPEKYKSKEEFLKQLTTRKAIYRRPVTKLVLLLAADEVPEECKLPLEELPTGSLLKQRFSPPRMLCLQPIRHRRIAANLLQQEHQRTFSRKNWFIISIGMYSVSFIISYLLIN